MFPAFRLYVNDHRPLAGRAVPFVRIPVGSTPAWRIVLYDQANRVPLDVTNLTDVSCTMASKISTGANVFYQGALAFTILDASTGTVEISMTATQTDYWPREHEKYGLELIFTVAGKTYRIWLIALVIPSWLDTPIWNYGFSGNILQDGSPVAGLPVHLTETDGTIIASTTTDGSGDYVFSVARTLLDGISEVYVYAANDTDEDGVIEMSDDIGGQYGAPDAVSVDVDTASVSGLDFTVSAGFS